MTIPILQEIDVQPNPIADFIDRLWRPTPDQQWLEQAAEKIRRWKIEDQENGEPWE